MTDHLIAPHGGALIDLLAGEERSSALQAASRDWPSWDLTPRQLSDLELLLNGAFSPLTGFMGQADTESVCQTMHLADGTLWPLPILLDVPEAKAEELTVGKSLALRDPEGVMLGALEIAEIWRPDREAMAQAVFGTTDRIHPGVAQLLEHGHGVMVSGRLEGLRLPVHYDFVSLRQAPKEIRQRFARLGWQRVVAFQTRNPMHRAHVELTLRAASELAASLLIHPVVGMTKPGDVDHYTRVRCYREVLKRYPEHTAMLSLLPLAMRMGGPREALLHAIIRKNFGCTHFIVGRDHAGPGKDANGKPFYGPYEAQDLMRQHEKELVIKMVPFRLLSYVQSLDKYLPEDEIPEGSRSM
jgi:sulfate adenylyltransferase